ncbi:cell division protein ZapE [Arthrobacter sp. Sa2BUA2]|uniref:Cell division protein ZapE n=1 Tax=Arthrobacter pullicola TaxID=2762224 RepID=A0ABR8YLQ1_9MICC|nr:cell division protein ZapE [Arthrobacter pullicola]MBD8045182.1 cell division protein ZapE [Arthrobacter pullicola]
MTSAQLDHLIEALIRQAEEAGMELDAGQRAVLPALARAGRAAAGGSAEPAPGSSVYLWGPPGRGKTWLLDAFYASVPVARKRRLHFHDFFRELHARTFAGYGRPGYRQGSAFADGLDALLGDARLLCFDEFHVNGPADAAFVTRLLEQVLDRGIVLVATSNYAPRELLPDPMFHHLFEPGIELITKNLHVAALDGGVDYRSLSDGRRRRSGFASGHHLRHAGTDLLAAAGLRPPAAGEARALKPGTVPLTADRAGHGQIWFRFAELCGARSAASDYLALAAEHPHWVVSAVPQTTDAGPDAWQRLGNLVDVLYDAGCRLDVIGFNDYDGVFPGNAHEADLARIRSRFGLLWVLG